MRALRLAIVTIAVLAGSAGRAAAGGSDAIVGPPDGSTGFDGGFDGSTGTDGGLVVDPTFLYLGQRDLGGGPSVLNGGFTLTNTNTSLVSITVTGFYKPADSQCNPFTVNTNGPLPQIFGPGQQRTWSVSFTSSIPGSYYCRVETIDNDGDYDFIDLYAEVVTPVMTVSPLPTMNFGDVMVGDSVTDWIYVYNDGSSNLVINAVTKGGSADFMMQPVITPETVPPFSSMVVMITYQPAAAGSDMGTVTISGNDPANPSDVVNLAGNGVADVTEPHLVASPVPLAFGSGAVGANINRTLTISNDGGATATISQLTITGSDASQFTLQSVCPGQQTCSTPIMVTTSTPYGLGVRCTPTSAGDKFATLTITSNASNSPLSVSMSCTGTAPDVSVSPLGADFGTIRLGTSSPGTNVTVRNLGNATLNYTLVETGDTGDFAATPPCSTTCSLGPGGMTTHSVVFTPQAYGNRASELRVTSNDPNDPIVPVYLAGVGGAGLITVVAPAGGALAFGDIPITTTSSPQTIQIRNDGNMTLTLTQLVVTLGNGVFVITGTVPPPNIVVNPGASHSVTVTCTPPVVQAYNGTILIEGNDPMDSDRTISLSCAGIDSDLVATPAPISFVPTRVGDSEVIPVTIENIGGVAITVNSIGVTPDVFEIEGAPSLPMSLGAGGMIELDLRFTPAADGDVEGELTVTPAAGDPLMVAVHGPGRVASYAVEPANYDFGTVCAGMSTVKRFTVTSTGSADIEVSLPALVDPDGAFDLAMIDPQPADYPATLTPLSMAVFDVVAMPPEGDSDGIIGVSTDVVPGGSTDVSLSAAAIADGIALSPSPLDFASVVINETSEIQSVTLANCDDVDLTITAVDITGDDADSFSVGGTLPPPDLLVAVQGSVQWTVVFEPERLGDHSATLEVTTSAGVMTVPLTGVGESSGGDGGGVDGGAGFDTTSYYACECRSGFSAGGAIPLVVAFLLLVVPRRRRRA
jgi:hypothetical protein